MAKTETETALQAPLQLAGGGLREGVVLEQLAGLRAEPA